MSSKGPFYRLAAVIRGLDVKSIHAKIEMNAPAVAPAAPKHAMVESVGMLPGRFTMTKGSSPPVARPMAAEYLYFAFWYMEKEVVRTRVMLKMGAKAPKIGSELAPILLDPMTGVEMSSLSFKDFSMHTSPAHAMP